MNSVTQALLATQTATIRNQARTIEQKEAALREIMLRTVDVHNENQRLAARVDELLRANSDLVSLNRSLSKSKVEGKHHGLDTDEAVYFYEQEFYVLSNFSAFEVSIDLETVFRNSDAKGRESLSEEFGVLLPKYLVFNTVEHAYHWFKFPYESSHRRIIRLASSAHDAFKVAQRAKGFVRPDWDLVKVPCMLQLLKAKTQQHAYVEKKLRETGERILCENSWRDSFWGWGEDRQGLNMLGRCWMTVRAELFDVPVPDSQGIPPKYLGRNPIVRDISA